MIYTNPFHHNNLQFLTQPFTKIIKKWSRLPLFENCDMVSNPMHVLQLQEKPKLNLELSDPRPLRHSLYWEGSVLQLFQIQCAQLDIAAALPIAASSPMELGALSLHK